MKLLQNFPSFTILIQNTWNTFRRFPFAMLSAISATTCALILSESDNASNELLVQKILLCSLLGIPLFIASKMFADRYHWKYLKSLRLQTIGFFLLVLYYVVTPLDFQAIEKLRLG